MPVLPASGPAEGTALQYETRSATVQRSSKQIAWLEGAQVQLRHKTHTFIGLLPLRN